MSFDRELMKGSTSLIILNILKEYDMYGYQIAKEMTRRSEEQLDVKEGTLYPALHKLEKKGYVTSYLKEQDKGPARKYYRLTQEGLIILKQKKKEWNIFSKMIDGMLEGE
ncbi:transcriptional regulator, PadR family [Clostridium aceticum]|uniref:Transcriptional regulator, PadR family n=1 Tax=Clostridium aceticum TaxID=84022 RepID=A0A0D8ICX1_9CLOT|nr:PadR family transcriptional regulator [Clostridium aceticum]AKL96023.1 transcriptional regulator, PadR family [Clostridium aceticum]KJF27041.1 DNA-binding protein [Clostridium aceticum]